MQIRHLRFFSSNSIYKASPELGKDFKAWLASGNYLINSTTQKEFVLYANNQNSLENTLSFDFLRFACASFESLSSITKPIHQKSTCWCSIKLYYSAFFAAHAILRYFDRGFSQIEPAQATIFNNYTRTFGIDQNISNGMYSYSYDKNTKLLTAKKEQDSHGDTWKNFKILINDLSNKILSDNAYQAAFTKNERDIFFNNLNDLIACICSNNHQNGNWLSSYRNDLNYKQAYDAWFPYNNRSLNYDDISSNFNISTLSPQLSLIKLERNDRKKFFCTCSSIIKILFLISSDIIEKKGGRAFFSQRISRIMHGNIR